MALATAQATLAALEAGLLKRENRDHILTDASLLGSGSWSFNRRKVTRQVWNAYDMNGIVAEVKERFAEIFEICAQHLTTDKKDTPTVRGDLGYYLLEVVRRTADEASSVAVPPIIAQMLHESAGGELDWRGTLWLRGVRVRDHLQIRPGLHLRPPNPDDFVSEQPSELADLGVASPWFFCIPDSVAEVSCKARDRPDLRREINALCLFRLGTVEVFQERWRTNSILPYMGSSEVSWHRSPRPLPAYELLSGEEATALARFLNVVAGELPIKPLGHHQDPRWAGLKSLFRALRTASDLEERLAQAVASLEASLLADLGGRSGLRYRLSLRTASLLRHAGFQPIQVFDNMQKAYQVRSKYAHGGELTNEDRTKAREIAPMVMNYARLVVVKLLEFPDKGERAKLLGQLDHALLDDDERRKLGELLTGGLWEYAN